MTSRHKYVTNIVLDPGFGTAFFVFSLNGMYDTDITGGGHQPSNFDLMTQVYRRYCVTDTKFLMQLSANLDDENLQPCYYGYLISPDPAAIGSSTATNDLMEQPYGMYAPLPASRLYGASQVAPLSAQVPLHTWFGCSRSNLLASAENSGDNANNPSRQLYSILWASPVNGNTPNSQNFRVELEFTAHWYLPNRTVFS